MNDRYLYRAKRIDNGEWVIGTPIFYKDGSITIISVNKAEYVGCNIYNPGKCDVSTLCACTGLKDKNGNIIWENDKCVVRRPCVLAYGTIKYLDGCFCFVEDKTGNILRLCDVRTNGFEIKVEYNISDNPELLEVGE